MKGDILSPDEYHAIDQGWVVDRHESEDDGLAQVIIRRDERLYSLQAAGGEQHLHIVDLGDVQGLNRSRS